MQKSKEQLMHTADLNNAINIFFSFNREEYKFVSQIQFRPLESDCNTNVSSVLNTKNSTCRRSKNSTWTCGCKAFSKRKLTIDWPLQCRSIDVMLMQEKQSRDKVFAYMNRDVDVEISDNEASTSNLLPERLLNLLS